MRVSDADHWTSPSLQAIVPSGDGESGFLTRMGIDGDLNEVMSSDSWERWLLTHGFIKRLDILSNQNTSDNIVPTNSLSLGLRIDLVNDG